MIRRFFVLCQRSLPCCECEFKLDNLLNHRMDHICRCLSAATFLSCAPRRDFEVYFLIPPNIGLEEKTRGIDVLKCKGTSIRHLRPDERNLAVILKKLLYRGKCTQGGDRTTHCYLEALTFEDSASPMLQPTQKCLVGLSYFNADCMSALVSTSRQCSNFLVEEGIVLTPMAILDLIGSQFSNFQRESDELYEFNFFLGDAKGYSDFHRELLLEVDSLTEICLGRQSLLTSHCIVLLHHYIDALCDKKRTDADLDNLVAQ